MAGKCQRPSLALVLSSATLLVCMGALLVETQTKALRRLFDDVVLDSRSHYLSCRQLPTYAEAQRVIAEALEASMACGERERERSAATYP